MSLPSVEVPGHYLVEVLELNTPVFVDVAESHHRFHHLFLQRLLELSHYIPQVRNRQVTLIRSIVFLEHFFHIPSTLIFNWSRAHCFHELRKRNTACLVLVEFGNDLVDGFFGWVETVFSQ